MGVSMTDIDRTGLHMGAQVRIERANLCERLGHFACAYEELENLAAQRGGLVNLGLLFRFERLATALDESHSSSSRQLDTATTGTFA
eukprot:COSAG05_NODE_2339_length_3212_cov_3.415997_3_plen_87_part_00